MEYFHITSNNIKQLKPLNITIHIEKPQIYQFHTPYQSYQLLKQMDDVVVEISFVKHDTFIGKITNIISYKRSTQIMVEGINKPFWLISSFSPFKVGTFVEIEYEVIKHNKRQQLWINTIFCKTENKKDI